MPNQRGCAACAPEGSIRYAPLLVGWGVSRLRPEGCRTRIQPLACSGAAGAAPLPVAVKERGLHSSPGAGGSHTHSRPQSSLGVGICARLRPSPAWLLTPARDVRGERGERGDARGAQGALTCARHARTCGARILGGIMVVCAEFESYALNCVGLLCWLI